MKLPADSIVQGMGEDILMGKEEDNTIRTMEKTDLYKRCPRTGHQK